MTESKKNKVEENPSDFKNIWDKLIKVDVSDILEVQQGLSYVSWGNAYQMMIENYPQMKRGVSEFMHPTTKQMLPFRQFPDGTVEVMTWVEIDGFKIAQTLPVMSKGKQHASQKNPTSREISDAQQRCYVKNYAMFGFGISVWIKDTSDITDDDDPVPVPVSDKDLDFDTDNKSDPEVKEVKIQTNGKEIVAEIREDKLKENLEKPKPVKTIAEAEVYVPFFKTAIESSDNEGDLDHLIECNKANLNRVKKLDETMFTDIGSSITTTRNKFKGETNA